MADAPQLKDLLDLEQLDLNLFRSRCHQENHRQHLFGGQVLGQSLVAAAKTCSDRQPHSIHGYFLRAGTSKMPVIYDVDPIRDGGSFTTRRVVARQHGKAIFSMAISFHKAEPGFAHADAPRSIPPLPADDAPAQTRQALLDLGLPLEMIEGMPSNTLIDFVPVDATPYAKVEATEARGQFWFRSRHRLPEDPDLHNCALLFASDMGLMATSVFPHPVSVFSDKLMPASLDHALWFHNAVDMNEWLLYETDSPWAGNARGFSRGKIFTAEGELVASTAQEGLIRPLT